MKKFWIYILVTFGFGWLCQGVAMLSAGFDPTGLVYTALLALCMFAPMFGVLAAEGGLKKARSGIRWKPVIKGRVRWWLAAWFGPVVLAILGSAVFYLLFPARFDGSMSLFSQAIEAQGLPIPAALLVAVSLAQVLTYAPFINMFFALGEEAGWRGWMTPFLTARMERKKALVLSGVIWGAWHWPIIMLAGYNFGTGYWGAPFTGALAMCVSCVALGILLSLLYEKTDSVWAPALCHGAFNAAASVGTFFLVPGTTSTLLGPTPLGLVAGIPMFLLAALILWNPQKQ